jgi:hypothetical protein
MERSDLAWIMGNSRGWTQCIYVDNRNQEYVQWTPCFSNTPSSVSALQLFSVSMEVSGGEMRRLIRNVKLPLTIFTFSFGVICFGNMDLRRLKLAS